MPESSNLLKGARVYLSGPMDFVASREVERKFGWRAMIGGFLKELGCTVFDPWNKPKVRGLHEYGKEDESSIRAREEWTFLFNEEGARARAKCSEGFWETVHIDLRMVDVSDFLIAFVPTNVYSVGTPHEIILARQQKKPVLFVSPRVEFSALEKLKNHLKDDCQGLEILNELASEVPIKSNPRHLPSLWYMPIVGVDHFFDGFGFSHPSFVSRFQKAHPECDDLERPLLPFLVELANGQAPKRWDSARETWEPDDDWLLLDSCLHLDQEERNQIDESQEN